jgi:hypothetical protein
MPRELIEPHKGDKRYVRRSKGGQFKESDDVGRSLAADPRTRRPQWSRKARVIAATKSARSNQSQNNRRFHQSPLSRSPTRSYARPLARLDSMLDIGNMR